MAQLTTPRIKQTRLDLRKTEVEAEGEEEEDRQSSLHEGGETQVPRLTVKTSAGFGEGGGGEAIVAGKHELAAPYKQPGTTYLHCGCRTTAVSCSRRVGTASQTERAANLHELH